jgi:hypothetical protein
VFGRPVTEEEQQSRAGVASVPKLSAGLYKVHCTTHLTHMYLSDGLV